MTIASMSGVSERAADIPTQGVESIAGDMLSTWRLIVRDAMSLTHLLGSSCGYLSGLGLNQTLAEISDRFF